MTLTRPGRGRTRGVPAYDPGMTAAMGLSGPLVTADQLLAMTGDDRFELMDGVLVAVSPADGGHGRIAATLLGELY